MQQFAPVSNNTFTLGVGLLRRDWIPDTLIAFAMPQKRFGMHLACFQFTRIGLCLVAMAQFRWFHFFSSLWSGLGIHFSRRRPTRTGRFLLVPVQLSCFHSCSSLWSTFLQSGEHDLAPKGFCFIVRFLWVSAACGFIKFGSLGKFEAAIKRSLSTSSHWTKPFSTFTGLKVKCFFFLFVLLCFILRCCWPIFQWNCFI